MVQVALRDALGTDFTLSECEQLVAAADKHGIGHLGLEEYLALCHGHL